jgi:hypothetical protein
MRPGGLVFGLLDTRARLADSCLANKLRSFTISWSRYSYSGLLVEGPTVNAILDQACDAGFRHCFIQAYGLVIGETWSPVHGGPDDFCTALCGRLEEDFFAAGRLVRGAQGTYGLVPSGLLVNLAHYAAWGRPAFEPEESGPVSLVQPVPRDLPGGQRLDPSGRTVTCRPTAPGWSFVEAGLRNGKAICGLDTVLAGRLLDLSPPTRACAAALRDYLDEDSARLGAAPSDARLTADQKLFLAFVARHAREARNGIFPFNFEPYQDIDPPPAAFRPPLTALYSVAAGLKPNRILQTHGFDTGTRVLFFDYSPKALEYRQLMVREWDGEDYPRFVRYAFRKIPAPPAMYQLGGDVSPEEAEGGGMDRLWREETGQWGGEPAFKEHWRAYRGLRHQYVLCNLLADPEDLLGHIEDRPGSVIWWSNAFFTVYSNWFHTVEERKDIYDAWVRGLAARAPGIFLYGADYNNSSVNHIRAGEYAARYRRAGSDCLTPADLHSCQIRS